MRRSELLQKWHATLTGSSTKLRQAILPALLVVMMLLYLWLPGVGSAAHRSLQNEVLALRTQATELERQALEVERLSALPPVPVFTDTLLLQVGAAASRAGLAASLLRSEASGPDQVTITANALGFAKWLLWLEELQLLNIRVDSARIVAAGMPGMVSVTATLQRPAAP